MSFHRGRSITVAAEVDIIGAESGRDRGTRLPSPEISGGHSPQKLGYFST